VRSSWDVVVVGGGPAGATTALLLARAGAAVVVLDRARFPRDKPCAEYVSPAAADVLERLGAGVVAAVERGAHARVRGMRVVAPDGTAMLGRLPRPGYALARARLDTILLGAARAAGAAVREGVTVEDLLWDRGAVAGVVARAGGEHREACRARVVVGADGLRSAVARRLGGVRRTRPTRIAFAAHVAGVAGVDGVGELHVSERGYVGLGPVGDGVTTVALVLPQRVVRRSARRGRDYRRDFFAELERFPGLAGRFDAGRLVRGVLATGPFAQWARASVAAGALLVGDAADFFDPFTGQGIYGALRGAELAAATLVRALRSGAGPVSRAALAPYRRARRRAFAGKWLLERAIGLGVGWPALTVRVVRRLAARPELADLLVGAAGNVVPARRVFAPRVLARLLW
jgi:geranylgeranyl reductase family protein